MIIYPSKIVEYRDKCRISADFESFGKKEELWYEYPISYNEFLVDENLDAFIVGLLFLALKNGENIEVKGSMSSRLNYTLNNYLIPAICLVNPEWKKIKVIALSLNENNLNKINVAGTGISCGVDSLATFFDHQNLLGSFKIKYLTYFNVGSHGDFGGEKSRNIFNKRIDRIQKFANEVKLPLIKVDSNLSEILQINFQKTHTLRNLSCVLNLQKLFKYYYYASAYRIDYFKLNKNDTSDFDNLTLNFIGTESLTFFSSMSKYNRIKRTELITNYKESYKYLDVCTSPSENNHKINCSRCDKCMRTQLTLDLLGKLNLYSDSFNIKIYHNEKNNFIAKILAFKDDNLINKDIYIMLKNMNKISYLHYFIMIKYKINKYKKSIKSIIKRMIK